MKKSIFFDVECYPNYFLAAFMNTEGKTHHIQILKDNKIDPTSISELKSILDRYQLIGFNSKNYDIPMIMLALKGWSTSELKKASDLIIERRLMYWQTMQVYNIRDPNCDHIDLINVLRGLHGLKKYAANLGYETIEDLPYKPDRHLSLAECHHVREYCINDLKITRFLFNHAKDRIDLRSKITKVDDYRSLSDAQIAEKIIRQKLGIQKPNTVFESVFKYQCPEFLAFNTPELSEYLQELKTTTYPMQLVRSGAKTNPLIRKVSLFNNSYKLGAGGLHSQEKGRTVRSCAEYKIIDIDVTSYYPMIILNNEFTPKHLGRRFLTVYKQLVNDRIAAKNSKDDPDQAVFEKAFKIVINGIFGKFGSKYSAVFSESLLLNVTLTGQLSLLMLIEMLESEGVEVLSANTDGVTCRVPTALIDKFRSVYGQWEEFTGFNLEETAYQVLCNLNVNSYFAVLETGDVKTKGAVFSPFDESSTPSGKIIGDAVIAHIKDNIPIDHYIKSRLSIGNIKEFLFVRSVSGGCKYGEKSLGKVARFYWSRSSDQYIAYCKNDNKVPRSDNSRPLLDIRELKSVDDIDLDRYVEAAYKTLEELESV